jgi:hypothetical protein
MNINEEADLCSLTWSSRPLMHTILELGFSNIWLESQQPVSKSTTERGSLTLKQPALSLNNKGKRLVN